MRRLTFALAAVTIVSLAAPVAAQEYLKVIPDDVLGFVVVNNMADASAKVQALAKKLGAPPVDLLALMKGTLGAEKGLQGKGSIVLAFFPGDRKPVEALLFFPVTDYQEFIKQLKPEKAEAEITLVHSPNVPFRSPVWIARKAGYAVLGFDDDKDILFALKKVLASTKDISASMQSLQPWLAGNDASAVLTPKGMKVLAEEARKVLGQGRAMFAVAPPEAQFVLSWIDALDGFLKLAPSEITHAAVGAKVDQGGNVQLSAQALLVKGGLFAKSLDGVKPLEGGFLTGLPGGPFVMAGGGVFPESAMQPLMNLSLQVIMAEKKLPEEKAKKLEEAFAQMSKGLKGGTMVLGVSQDTEPLLGRSVSMMKVDNAKSYLTKYEKALRAEYEALDVPVESKNLEVSGVPVLEMVIDMSSLLPAGGEAEKKAMAKVFGPDGKMTFSIAAPDDKGLIMCYTPADGLKPLLLNYLKGKGGLADDADIAKTAALLPAGAQWGWYLSPEGTVDFVDRCIKAFAPEEVQALKIPKFPKTPPVGFAVKAAPAALEARLVVPAAALEGLGAFIEKVKKMQGF